MCICYLPGGWGVGIGESSARGIECGSRSQARCYYSQRASSSDARKQTCMKEQTSFEVFMLVTPVKFSKIVSLV